MATLVRRTTDAPNRAGHSPWTPQLVPRPRTPTRTLRPNSDAPTETGTTSTACSTTERDTETDTPSPTPVELDGGAAGANQGGTETGGATNGLPPAPTVPISPTNCPPCVAPPSPGCVGSGPCGCGPYVCPDNPVGAGGSIGAGGGSNDEIESPPGSSCRAFVDCEDLGLVFPVCLSPGESLERPGVSCGAPDWCGDCECPPKPGGIDTACSSDADCPGYIDPYSSDEVLLTRCDTATGQCEGCLDDADCSGDTPQCTLVPETFIRAFKRCTACDVDADCPIELPHCVAVDLNDEPTGTRVCQQCLTTSECETGVCSFGECIPGCNPDSDGCGPIETSQCNAETLRCGVRPCDDANPCAANTDCVLGACSRRMCESDGECEGYCVNGYCYDDFGQCEDEYYPQPP
jgi:hypothetical protein